MFGNAPKDNYTPLLTAEDLDGDDGIDPAVPHADYNAEAESDSGSSSSDSNEDEEAGMSTSLTELYARAADEEARFMSETVEQQDVRQYRHGYLPGFQEGTRISSHVPSVSDNFVPRLDAVEAVVAAVLAAEPDEPTDDDDAGAGATVVLNSPCRDPTVPGMGGAGKTVVASFAVRDDRVQSKYDHGVFWVQLSSEVVDLSEPMFALLRDVGFRQLGQRGPFDFTMEQLAGYLRDFFGDSRNHMLIVLDNVWDARQIEPFRACAGPHCTLLVTTRKNDLAVPESTVSLGVLDQPQSLQFVATHLEGSGVLPEEGTEEYKAMVQAVGHAGGLPAALALLCGLVRSRSTSWSTLSMELSQTSLRDATRWEALLGISLRFLKIDDRRLYNAYRRLVVKIDQDRLNRSDLQELWVWDEDEALDMAEKLADRGLLLRAGEDFMWGSVYTLHDLHVEWLERSTNSLLVYLNTLVYGRDGMDELFIATTCVPSGLLLAFAALFWCFWTQESYLRDEAMQFVWAGVGYLVASCVFMFLLLACYVHLARLLFTMVVLLFFPLHLIARYCLRCAPALTRTKYASGSYSITVFCATALFLVQFVIPVLGSTLYTVLYMVQHSKLTVVQLLWFAWSLCIVALGSYWTTHMMAPRLHQAQQPRYEHHSEEDPADDDAADADADQGHGSGRRPRWRRRRRRRRPHETLSKPLRRVSEGHFWIEVSLHCMQLYAWPWTSWRCPDCRSAVLVPVFLQGMVFPYAVYFVIGVIGRYAGQPSFSF